VITCDIGAIFIAKTVIAWLGWQVQCVAYHGTHTSDCDYYCPELSNHGADESRRAAFINGKKCFPNALRPSVTGLGDVSPLAILARCQENYARKRWDDGLFAAFHNTTMEVSGLRRSDVEEVQAAVRALGSPELEACLRQGSVSQRIETCTDLYFQHSGVTGGKPMREDYFTYGSTTGTDFMPDACGFLSAPVTGSWSSSMLPRVLACQDEQQDLPRLFASSSTDAGCTIPWTTRAMDRGRQQSVVRSYRDRSGVRIPRERYMSDLRAMHAYVDEYALPTPDDLKQHDFALESFEGDLLHRLVDCVVAGPYASVELMPADPGGLAESLVFRPPSANETETDPPLVFDSLRASQTQVASQTRGSGTRVALLNALLFEQRQGLLEKLRDAIVERVEEWKESFAPGQVESFDRECNKNDPDACTPIVDINFILSVQDITGQADTSVLDTIRGKSQVSLLLCVVWNHRATACSRPSASTSACTTGFSRALCGVANPCSASTTADTDTASPPWLSTLHTCCSTCTMFQKSSACTGSAQSGTPGVQHAPACPGKPVRWACSCSAASRWSCRHTGHSHSWCGSGRRARRAAVALVTASSLSLRTVSTSP